jgi:hypothetical protein
MSSFYFLLTQLRIMYRNKSIINQKKIFLKSFIYLQKKDPYEIGNQNSNLKIKNHYK